MCICSHAHAHTHTHIMFHFVRKLPHNSSGVAPYSFGDVLSSGVALNSGDALLVSGNALLSSGDALLSSGDALLSSGDALLSSGVALLLVHFQLRNDVYHRVTSSPSTLFELSALHCLALCLSRRLNGGPPTSSTCQQLRLLVIPIVTRNHWKQATQTQAEATQAKQGRNRETEKAFSSLSLEYKKLLPHIFTAVDHTACPTTPRTSRTILHTVCHFPPKTTNGIHVFFVF